VQLKKVEIVDLLSRIEVMQALSLSVKMDGAEGKYSIEKE